MARGKKDKSPDEDESPEVSAPAALPPWVARFNLETDEGCLSVVELSTKSFLMDELPQKKHEAVMDAVRLACQIGLAKHRKAPKAANTEIPMGITANGPFNPFGRSAGGDA